MERYTYEKASRWIKIRYMYITEKHSLWDYAEPCSLANKRQLCCFKHKDKLYAIDQFMRLSYPIMFDDTNGDQVIIGGYDSASYYNPYLLEIDDGGEYVRLWIEYTVDEVENDENDID